MTRPHFLAPSVEGDEIVLHGEEARHAARVLRVRAGERITVGDGRGSVVEGRCIEVGTVVRAQVESRRQVERARPSIRVFQALPKAGKLETIVQKLAEVGARAVHPWPSQRSVVRWDERKARAQVDRLRSVAREAAKQSRSPFVLEVADVAALDDVPPATVVLHEEARARLREVLPHEPPDEVGLVVGPEGGLTEDEVRLLEGMGARPATLGPQVLRTETAPLVAAALVAAHYGHLG